MSLQAKGVVVCISIAALIFFILVGALSLSKPTQKLGKKAASSSTNLAGSSTNLAGSSTNLAGSSTNLAGSSTNLAGITNHLAGLSSAIGNALFGETRRKHKIAQGIENQHAIGKAYAAYLADNDGWYPVVRGAAGVGGKTGNSRGPRGPFPAVVGKFYGASVPEKERPLNAYIGSIKSFHDPADTGGGAYNVHSCWDSFGNSYQPQVADDMFRVKRILGEKSEKEGSYEGTSMRESEISKPKNKIIQGDWNWPYDREDTWHAKDGEARHIMLYADGHAREFVFPPTQQMLKWITPPPHGEMPKPDPNYIWW